MICATECLAIVVAVEVGVCVSLLSFLLLAGVGERDDGVGFLFDAFIHFILSYQYSVSRE